MQGLMPLDEAKRIIKTATERQPITFYPMEDGNGYYPYCILPIEARTETIDAVTSGLSYMYSALFSEDGVTTVVYPEAKAFLFTDFERLTGTEGLVTRKRRYPGVPGQIVITMRTPYRGETYMYCVGLRETDTGVIILDDMISGSMTMTGHTEAFDEMVRVFGGLSVYERGDGLDVLMGRYPEKKFGGFARLEIVARDEKTLTEISRGMECIDEEEVPQMFIAQVVEKNRHLPEKIMEERVFAEINEKLKPSIPYFFDKRI